MTSLPRTSVPAQGSRPPDPQVSEPYASSAVALHRSGLGGPGPLPPGCKSPPLPGWTGAEGAYPSTADVFAWIEDHPGGNVALRLADGVIGIDVDAYASKGGSTTLAAAETALGALPPTFTSTSRTDGVSGIRLFRVPLGTALVSTFGAAGYGPAVEIVQRTHRYVVAPPSLHPEGRTYRWVGPDGIALHTGEVPGVDDLPELPPAWVAGLAVDASRAEVGREVLAAPEHWPTASVTAPYVRTLLDGLATDTPRSDRRTGEPGNWHDWTFSSCCRLAAAARLGLITSDDLARGQRTVAVRLREAAPSRSSDEAPGMEAGRCWRDAVERTARQSDEQARASLGIRPDRPAPGVEQDQEHPVDEETAETDAPPSWGRINLTTYLDGTHKPQEATLLRRTDGVALLYAGRVHSFHGESESGKSWAALVAARDVLADGGRVVMLDYESDAATVVGRLLLLGVDRTAIAQRFDYRRPEVGPNATSDEREAWFDLLRERADLVILDGVTEALATIAATSTDNDEVTRWVREVARRLAQRTGGAVVMVDHVTKDADTRGRYAIGGQAKMAALDGAAYVVEVVSPLGIGMRGALALRVAKDRGGQVRPHSGAWRKSDRTQETAVLTIDSTEPGVTVATLDPPRTTTVDAAGGASEPAGPFRPTNLMERASRASHAVAEPQSRNELVRATGGNKTAALVAVERLVAEGHLASDGPRRGGHPTLRFVSLYTESADRFQNQNHSASPEPSSGTGTGSRSQDRGPGTSHRNQSDRFHGTSQNQSGTSDADPSALAGVDLCQECFECDRRVGHLAGCSRSTVA